MAMDDPVDVDLRPRIQHLIDESERLFLGFAKSFPVFGRELQASLNRSKTALQSLGSGAALEDALRTLFASTRALVGNAGERFRAMRERDATLLEALNSGIDTLGSLDNDISRIRDDSVEMELISLNAMTVALKSGADGKAFSVITEELKRLSGRTISLTELLTEDGRNLLALFRRYGDELVRLKQTQHALFEGLEERIAARFAELESAVRAIAVLLGDMAEGSRAVEAPVSDIMATVQIQDIVSQSLNHVLMALDEMTEAESTDPLERAAFRKSLAELAVAILEDVQAKIDDAGRRFREAAQAVSDAVTLGERQRRKMLDEQFGQGDAGMTAAAFKVASQALSDISAQTESYFKTKDSIAQNGARLSGAVEMLAKHFQAFSKIINRFRTIDIASRIEVSKQDALRSMGDTVLEMSVLTDRIGADVQGALTVTQAFIGETKQAIHQYGASAGEEAAVFNHTEIELQDAHRRLDGLKEDIRSGAQNFNLFTSEFIGLLKVATGELEALTTLSSAIAQAGAEFAAIRDAGDAVLSNATNADALRAGEVHSDRLKEIIARFTIYAHKRAAAEIGGFQVESGSELGEVTFF
jgi:hypothetical protein